MKVLHINTVPKHGSIGKIVYDLHKRLKNNGCESKICYGRGGVYPSEPDLINISSEIEVYWHAAMTRITGNAGSYSNKATDKLITIIEDYSPDIVQLFNLHGYYMNEFRLLNYLKHYKIKTVYTMLDEYPYMGKCCYSFECDKFRTRCSDCPQTNDYPQSLLFDKSAHIFDLKRQAYEGFENIIFTAPQWVVERAQSSALLKNKRIVMIDESIDLEEIFYPRETDALRSKLGISPDKVIILTVAQYSNSRKGGKYFLELAGSMTDNNYIFVHVGYDGSMKSLPQNMIPVKYVKNQEELAAYYSLADLFVITSLADTMANVCLESLACGTPICGFDDCSPA
jgi:glycosyltransferase involved in cell wall biosynthesis